MLNTILYKIAHKEFSIKISNLKRVTIKHDTPGGIAKEMHNLGLFVSCSTKNGYAILEYIINEKNYSVVTDFCNSSLLSKVQGCKWQQKPYQTYKCPINEQQFDYFDLHIAIDSLLKQYGHKPTTIITVPRSEEFRYHKCDGKIIVSINKYGYKQHPFKSTFKSIDIAQLNVANWIAQLAKTYNAEIAVYQNSVEPIINKIIADFERVDLSLIPSQPKVLLEGSTDQKNRLIFQ